MARWDFLGRRKGESVERKAGKAEKPEEEQPSPVNSSSPLPCKVAVFANACEQWFKETCSVPHLQ